MRGAWIALLLLAGCSQQTDLMPLETGKKWQYTVRGGFESFVEDVEVGRELPVAGVKGYEVGGPLGIGRYAWRKEVLFMESGSNARFTPPLPILASDQEPRKWGGIMESMGKPQKCTATLEHSWEKIRIGGHELGTTLSVVKIQTPRTVIEIKTWFQPKVGIVQQEQRTGGKLDVGIQLASPPQI